MNDKLPPSSKIHQLEARTKRLEQEKMILNRAIDIADEQFGTNIRKKYLPLSQAAFRPKGLKEPPESN